MVCPNPDLVHMDVEAEAVQGTKGQDPQQMLKWKLFRHQWKKFYEKDSLPDPRKANTTSVNAKVSFILVKKILLQSFFISL